MPAVFVVDARGELRFVCAECLTPVLSRGDAALGEAARFLLALARPQSPAPTDRQDGASALAPCRVCGLTYAEASQTGLLGCSSCYDAFRSALRSARGASDDR